MTLYLVLRPLKLDLTTIFRPLLEKPTRSLPPPASLPVVIPREIKIHSAVAALVFNCPTTYPKIGAETGKLPVTIELRIHRLSALQKATENTYGKDDLLVIGIRFLSSNSLSYT